MLRRFVLTASLLLSALSLAQAADPAAKPAGKQAFGKAFSDAKAPATPIADVIAKADQFDGKPVKVSGTVTQVCQAKGCWFEVAAGPKEKGVRIKSADYSIFVPKDSSGRSAVVEGTFKVTTLTEAQAKHLADDAAKAGVKADEVKGPVKEFQLAATAVEFN
jgi:uncharacterized protein YdeI (BOF family)